MQNEQSYNCFVQENTAVLPSDSIDYIYIFCDVGNAKSFWSSNGNFVAVLGCADEQQWTLFEGADFIHVSFAWLSKSSYPLFRKSVLSLTLNGKCY